VGEQGADSGDVCVDEVVVALVTDAGVPGAEVHVVVEKFEVVGPHVQHHGQYPESVVRDEDTVASNL